ncbi:MAG: ABC transporter permease [Planctomycetota bacterium]|nr:MAG: ABC transporter permease [Planctomycetota bacterium]
MNLFTIAWKNLKQRSLASVLTMVSVALGVALMVTVLVLHGVIGKMFSQSGTGYDLIIGPQGSETQLVLSTVYRIDKPIENLPWRYYLQWKDDPRVDLAIPFCFGDTTNEGNFPVIGTSPQFFKAPYARTPEPQQFRVWNPGDFLQGTWDAVIGAEVARKNQWGIGSQFQLLHGGNTEDGHVHDEKFTVKGVLKPTGTPNDRCVFVHVDGFFLLAGHEKPLIEAIQREALFFAEDINGLKEKYKAELAHAAEDEAGGHDHAHHAHAVPDVAKEVTSILLVMKRDPTDQLAATMSSLGIKQELKKGMQAQAVNPIQVMSQIMSKLVGNLQTVLLFMTGLIIAVSGIGVFVSIYNSMAERRREIAIMRALGAQRTTVSMIILCETVLLCVGGGLLGLVLGHGLVYVASPIIEARSGLLLDPRAWSPYELVVVPISIGLAILSGLIPSITAYRTDVAETLAN